MVLKQGLMPSFQHKLTARNIVKTGIYLYPM